MARSRPRRNARFKRISKTRRAERYVAALLGTYERYISGYMARGTWLRHSRALLDTMDAHDLIPAALRRLERE